MHQFQSHAGGTSLNLFTLGKKLGSLLSAVTSLTVDLRVVARGTPNEQTALFKKVATRLRSSHMCILLLSCRPWPKQPIPQSTSIYKNTCLRNMLADTHTHIHLHVRTPPYAHPPFTTKPRIPNYISYTNTHMGPHLTPRANVRRRFQPTNVSRDIQQTHHVHETTARPCGLKQSRDNHHDFCYANNGTARKYSTSHNC